MKIEQFESIVARIPDFVSDKNGIQIKHKTLGAFAFGEICRRNELEWERPLNLLPSHPIWQALFYAALAQHKKSKVCVVVGAPKSIVAAFNDLLPIGETELALPGEQRFLVNVTQAIAVPECAGHALAYQQVLGTHCVVISVGFGTVELGAATKEGIIERSLESINYGIHRAAILFRKKSIALGYDNPNVLPEQYHYWDNVMLRVYQKDENLILQHEGKIFEWVDLYDAAIEALTEYSHGLVQQMKAYFARFTDRMPVILTGGGVNFSPVNETLSAYFVSRKMEVQVAPPEISLVSAATGYRIIGQKLFGDAAIGIDIGNHNIVTLVDS